MKRKGANIMILYPYALFFHIVGVLGVFIANSLAVTVVFRLRAAKTTTQVREWLSVNSALEKILPVSAVLILASGLYMTFTAWGWGQAWIDLSLGVLGPAINGRRLQAIHLAVEVAPDGEVPASLQQRLSDPILRAYALIPGFLLLGVVGLMTLKPDWIGSGVVLVMAFVVSLIAGQLSRGTPHQAQDEKERAGHAIGKY
jgi:hypothetical protein